MPLLPGWLRSATTAVVDRVAGVSGEDAKGPPPEGQRPDSQRPNPSSGKSSPPPQQQQPKAAPPRSAKEMVLRAVPLAMLVIGALLTACAELLEGWYVLGFLLLVAAPIVYWLQRIEARLAKLEPRKPGG